ncbi:hypothetical protein MHYP_G00016070 [Metynnis hypsauchen]
MVFTNSGHFIRNPTMSINPNVPKVLHGTSERASGARADHTNDAVSSCTAGALVARLDAPAILAQQKLAVLTLLFSPVQCTIAWLCVASPLSTNELLLSARRPGDGGPGAAEEEEAWPCERAHTKGPGRPST